MRIGSGQSSSSAMASRSIVHVWPPFQPISAAAASWRSPRRVKHPCATFVWANSQESCGFQTPSHSANPAESGVLLQALNIRNDSDDAPTIWWTSSPQISTNWLIYEKKPTVDKGVKHEQSKSSRASRTIVLLHIKSSRNLPLTHKHGLQVGR